MSKVKLTREQAEALEEVMKDRTKTSLIRESANPFMSAGGYMCEKNHIVFNEIDLETLIKALYIGYEVEPVLELGEYIKFQNERHEEGVVGKITRITGNTLYLDDKEYPYYYKCTLSNVTITNLSEEEIAKEKQRRWWAKHGREVWELKENDSILNQSEHDWYPDIIKSTNEFNVELSDREYIPWHLVKRDYKVFCFAEDRKDVQA